MSERSEPPTPDAAEMVKRLREAHTSSQQRVLGSDIFDAAATLIDSLLARIEKEQNLYWQVVEERRVAFERAEAAEDEAINLRRTTEHYRNELHAEAMRHEALTRRAEAAESRLTKLQEVVENVRDFVEDECDQTSFVYDRLLELLDALDDQRVTDTLPCGCDASGFLCEDHDEKR